MKTSPLFVVAVFSFAISASAEESTQDKITRALSAAPSDVSDQATVMDGDGTILREGTNGWTCLPDTMPGDKAPLCNDAVWMEMMQAMKNKADYTPSAIGISYMLQGEPSGSGVSNSDPYHQDHASAHDYVETGPHIMLVVPKPMLDGIPTDPKQGGPYVMWADTPYAHIMIPVSVEGKQVKTQSPSGEDNTGH